MPRNFGKMICKVVIFISIVTCVYGSDTDQAQNVAISTQSFHRENGPLYKYRNVHDYIITKNNQRGLEPINNQHRESPVRIQYAPLPQELISGDVRLIDEKQIVPTAAPVHLLEEGRHVYSTEANVQKSHLEPRLVTQFIDNNQGVRSFIPGHNVELLPPPINRFLGHVDSFVTRQDIQKQQATAPKYVYYQKKLQYYNNAPSQKKVENQAKPNDLYLLGYLPKELNESFKPKESRAAQANAYSLHNEFAVDKPIQSYQHGPHLHLNIARFYRIANQQQQAPILSIDNQPHEVPQQHKAVVLPQTHMRQVANIQHKAPETQSNVVKPSTNSQSFFLPRIIDSHNTYLYPVRKE